MKPSETRITLEQQWVRWQGVLLVMSISMMALLAALWLGYQGWRLLWQPAELAGRPVHPGAFDLIERYNELRLWFSGQWVRNNVYPPASHLMLWPLLGWLPLQGAIRLWALLSAVALGWLAVTAVRESGVTAPMPRLWVALIPFSMYAPGATIGNGQLNLFVLPMLVAGVLALRRRPASWPGDLSASLLILGSLVKPSFSAPFFWIVALGLGRWRPAGLIAVGYVLAALVASPFNTGGPIRQHMEWVSIGSASASYSSAAGGAAAGATTWPTELSINALQFLLTQIGLRHWTSAASLLVLACLGVWVYRNRRADTWLLLGVTALAARFWTYHRWYDDILILLPMITLIRIAGREARPATSVAGWLLVGAVLTSLAPGGLFLLPPPLDGVYVIGQLAVWLSMLGYLLFWGRQRA